MLCFSKFGQKTENLLKMPYVRALTNHSGEGQKIKVRGVLKTFSIDLLSHVKCIPKHICILGENDGKWE